GDGTLINGPLPPTMGSLIFSKKKARQYWRAKWLGRRPTLPGVTPVPSARQGLTSLFGMGRGGAPALGRPMSVTRVTVHVLFPRQKSYVLKCLARITTERLLLSKFSGN